jgi:ABC-type multidrug transport system permease subunit
VCSYVAYLCDFSGELVPLLAELDDDEVSCFQLFQYKMIPIQYPIIIQDEVLQAIAHELGGLIELVGGAAHCAVLLVPLERLAQVEEVAVRDRVMLFVVIVVVCCLFLLFVVCCLFVVLLFANWKTGC